MLIPGVSWVSLNALLPLLRLALMFHRFHRPALGEGAIEFENDAEEKK